MNCSIFFRVSDNLHAMNREKRQNKRWVFQDLEFSTFLLIFNSFRAFCTASKHFHLKNIMHLNASILPLEFLFCIIPHYSTIHAGAKILNLSKNSHFENPNFHKIHISEIPIFTKFTFLKSHFSQNSHFLNLIFHKIHISEISIIT